MVRHDSHILFGDSLQTIADSFLVDSVQVISSGYEGIALPQTVQTVPWVFIILLFLLFLPIFVYRRSPAVFIESPSMLVSVNDRNSLFSKATTSDSLLRTIMFFFFIVVLSFHITIFFQQPTDVFTITKGISVLLLTFVFFIVKMLIIRMLVYVFFSSSLNKAVVRNYQNILAICGVILYLLLVLKIYCPADWTYILDIITLAVLFLSILFVAVKMFQIFFSKFIDLFYILLYLCTLEILPVFYLYRAYQSMI